MSPDRRVPASGIEPLLVDARARIPGVASGNLCFERRGRPCAPCVGRRRALFPDLFQHVRGAISRRGCRRDEDAILSPGASTDSSTSGAPTPAEVESRSSPNSRREPQWCGAAHDLKAKDLASAPNAGEDGSDSPDRAKRRAQHIARSPKEASVACPAQDAVGQDPAPPYANLARGYRSLGDIRPCDPALARTRRRARSEVNRGFTWNGRKLFGCVLSPAASPFPRRHLRPLASFRRVGGRHAQVSPADRADPRGLEKGPPIAGGPDPRQLSARQQAPAPAPRVLRPTSPRR